MADLKNMEYTIEVSAGKLNIESENTTILETEKNATDILWAF